MDQETLNKIHQYIAQNIDDLHSNRLNKVKNIKLDDVLKRKNPYLFKAKNLNNALDFVTSILDASLSSSEEEAMGRFLEGLAIYVAELSCGGCKSATKGIDLDMTKDGIRYIVAIKSGPNWGNSQQYAALRENFRKAITVLRQDKRTLPVQAVLGICYGKFRDADTGLYIKIGGQRFWEFISGSETLYLDIIEPFSYEAKKHNKTFLEERQNTYKRFAEEFEQKFMKDGQIDWVKLVQFNSRNILPPKEPKRRRTTKQGAAQLPLGEGID